MALSFLGFLPLSVLGLVIRGKALKADIPWVETLGHGAYIDLAILPMWIASGALYWVFVNRSQLREASRG